MIGDPFELDISFGSLKKRAEGRRDRVECVVGQFDLAAGSGLAFEPDHVAEVSERLDCRARVGDNPTHECMECPTLHACRGGGKKVVAA